MGWKLGQLGADILRKGGHDDASDDDMLLMEITKRAPGLSKQDLQDVFVAIRMEYGEDGLKAIQQGYIQFEERPNDGGNRGSKVDAG